MDEEDLNSLNRIEQSGTLSREFSDQPYATMPFSEQNKRLWDAGCRCTTPLLGWRPFVGPRCRLCNITANAWDAYEEPQTRIV